MNFYIIKNKQIMHIQSHTLNKLNSKFLLSAILI
jgi:hypothetical protein